MRKQLRVLALILALCVLSGCSAIPVDRLLIREDPTAYPVLPEATPASLPPASPEAYRMELTHASGKMLVIEDADAARLLLLAAVDQSQRTQDAGYDFPHKVTVLNGMGDALVTLEIAGGGEAYARDPDGQIFFLPQYCQSVLERALWPEYLSLWQEPWQWSGDPDATAALEARLPYLLNTFLAGEYGWADAYFSTYKVYEVKTSSRQATLYLLALRKAMKIGDGQFQEVASQAVPMRLTLDKLNDGSWRLSSVKAADFSKGVSRDAVRAVFSYDMTKTVMEDLNDLSDMEASLKLQIRSYMLQHRLNDLTWEG